MTISINETDIAVAEFLKANNFRFLVSFVGSGPEDGWKYDKWTVTIQDQTFEYRTGIAHRIQHGKNAYKMNTKQLDSVKALRDLLGKDRLDATVHKLSDGQTYVVSPTQASVIYCLLLDAESADQNFNGWCSDYGYDNDSMAAFKTYQACCDTLEKVRKIFNHSQRQELQELLQDY